MNIKKKKHSLSVYSVVVCLILCIYTFTLFAILGWGLIKSFHGLNDFILGGSKASSWPKAFTLQNYIKAFEVIKYPLPRKYGGGYVLLGEMMLNSVIYAVGCALIDTFTTAAIAYVTVKHRFAFNKVINTCFYITVLLPIVSATGAGLRVMTELGLIHTWIGVFWLKLNFTSGMGFLLFQGVFKSLDDGYKEAALIDGASHFRIMVSISFPLVKTIILTLMMQNFISYWNDYSTPMFYLAPHPTAAYGLYFFNQDKSGGGATAFVTFKVAGFMMLLIPVFIVFLFLKDKMMGNLTEGGLKG